MPEETPAAPRQHLLSPSGRFCPDVLVEGSKYAYITSLDGLNVDDWELGDIPTMEIHEMLGAGAVVVDTERAEWLIDHCRIVVGEFEPEDFELGVICEWPENIQKACSHMLRLHDVIRQIDRLKSLAPADFCDTVTAVVLDEIVTKRCKVEIEGLQAIVDAYRAIDPPVVIHTIEAETEEEGDA